MTSHDLSINEVFRNLLPVASYWTSRFWSTLISFGWFRLVLTVAGLGWLWLLAFHGIPWDSMGFHGIPWDPPADPHLTLPLCCSFHQTVATEHAAVHENSEVARDVRPGVVWCRSVVQMVEANWCVKSKSSKGSRDCKLSVDLSASKKGWIRTIVKSNKGAKETNVLAPIPSYESYGNDATWQPLPVNAPRFINSLPCCCEETWVLPRISYRAYSRMKCLRLRCDQGLQFPNLRDHVLPYRKQSAMDWASLRDASHAIIHQTLRRPGENFGVCGVKKCWRRLYHLPCSKSHQFAGGWYHLRINENHRDIHMCLQKELLFWVAQCLAKLWIATH